MLESISQEQIIVGAMIIFILGVGVIIAIAIAVLDANHPWPK